MNNQATNDAAAARNPADTGLWSLVLLLQYLQVGADVAQLKHQAGKGDEATDVEFYIMEVSEWSSSVEAKFLPFQLYEKTEFFEVH